MEVEAKEIVVEIADALSRGNIALWIGRTSGPLTDDRLLQIPWLGVWSEPNNQQFSTALEKTWSERTTEKSRFVREVPFKVEETLGTYFSFVDVCPVFYLNGIDNQWAKRPERENRRDRDEKIDLLERLDDAVLIVLGIEGADEIGDFLSDELGGQTAKLRVLFISVEESVQRRVVERTPKVAYGNIRFWPKSLDAILDELNAISNPLSDSDVELRVGQAIHSIKLDLQRENPIDQFFEIVTTNYLTSLDANISNSNLLEMFLRGSIAQYKILRNRLHWERYREQLSEIKFQILNALTSKVSKASLFVFNLAVEYGSGATTFLKEIAVSFALDGNPALYTDKKSESIDYDTLRVFLERLPDEKKDFPPILIFDSDSKTFARDDHLGLLASQLSRDGQPCVIVRTIAFSENDALTDERKKQISLLGKSSKFEEYWIPHRIKARISTREQASLAAWAASVWGRASANILSSVLNDWNSEPSNPPFLIYLYFVLRNEVAATNELGRHIFSRVERVIEKSEKQTGREVLTGQELNTAIQILKAKFTGTRSEVATATLPRKLPSKSEIIDLFVTLAVLGKLRIEIPRSTISRILNQEPDNLQNALIEFEGQDLTTSFTTLRRAPGSYYSEKETIALRHPGYGDVVLDWMRDSTDFHPSEFSDFTKAISSENAACPTETYPIRLLLPILKRLNAHPLDVEFADFIAKNFLRLQRIPGSNYHEWLWEGGSEARREKADLLLELLSHIPEDIMRQRASLLHSRGITRYKSCSPNTPLEDCRIRYQAASKDFELAIERAENQQSGDQPANIASSFGMLYLGWGSRERDSGNYFEANELEQQAWSQFNRSMELRPTNPFAAFGLSNLLLARCDRILKSSNIDSQKTEAIGHDLSTVCQLLQIEPSDSLRYEWEAMWLRLVELLENEKVKGVIKELEEGGKEIGFALEALQILKGSIPQEPTKVVGELAQIRQALRLLEGNNRILVKSPVADFLRYVLFSTLEERLVHPEFGERFSRIIKLEDTPFLRIPIWLFDYGMLAFQQRDFTRASEAFRKLRYGRKFIEVPTTRSRFWMEEGNESKIQIAHMRVLNVDEFGRGWARLDKPSEFKDPIPFSVAEFRSAGGSVLEPGNTRSCQIRIRPSGCFAVPVPQKKEA